MTFCANAFSREWPLAMCVCVCVELLRENKSDDDVFNVLIIVAYIFGALAVHACKRG